AGGLPLDPEDLHGPPPDHARGRRRRRRPAQRLQGLTVPTVSRMAEATPPSRRRVLTSLGAAVLGTGALAACTRRTRGGRSTTPPPTAAAREEPTSPLILGSIGSA